MGKGYIEAGNMGKGYKGRKHGTGLQRQETWGRITEAGNMGMGYRGRKHRAGLQRQETLEDYRGRKT